jgi:hypothetical protein
MVCNLAGQENTPSETHEAALAGTLVASFQHNTDKDNNGGVVFIFDDLLIEVEGKFRLQFDLFEIDNDQCSHIKSITSDPFIVRSAETFLTRFFKKLGVWGPALDDSYAQPLHRYSQLHISNQRSSCSMGTFLALSQCTLVTKEIVKSNFFW